MSRMCDGILNLTAGMRIFFIIPRLGCANPAPPPPLVNITVRFGWKIVMQHGTQPTKEIGVDKLARPFPSEIGIVKIIVFA